MNKGNVNRFIKEYTAALNNNSASLFVGAGTSMEAGYPSWIHLLKEIAEELNIKLDHTSDLAAVAQWAITSVNNKNRVHQTISDQIGINRDIPESLKIIARLPLYHIWTTNYDRLIERAFEEQNRPIQIISCVKDLSIRLKQSKTRLYKMHGDINRLDDIVISTDDYELYRAKRGLFIPLLQAHLTGLCILFVGLSFTDPNVRHVLSLIRENFTDSPPEHFAIVRPPQREDFSLEETELYQAQLSRHNHWKNDLKRYGLIAIEINKYNEIPELLQKVENCLANQRVWISGSWLLNEEKAEFNYQLAEKIGSEIARLGLSLVSGYGLIIGSASITGFLSGLPKEEIWNLGQRLFTRPFPQSIPNQEVKKEHWSILRKELARLAGIVVFIGGKKIQDGQKIDADGVWEEFEYARDNGAFLIPIGATGGTAKRIAETLLETSKNLQKPTNEEIQLLLNPEIDIENTLKLVTSIIQKTLKNC